MTHRLTKIVPAAYRALGLGYLASQPWFDGVFLAAFFAYKKYVEDPFAALVRSRPDLFEGGNVLDVGANAGYTASVFAAAVSPGARVYAFEPEPVNYRRLLRTIRGRHLDDVVIPYRSAVGAFEGEVDLAINRSHPGDHRVVSRATAITIRVPQTKLDAFETAAFVKIDTQGHELEVSKGMTQLIDRSPHISIAFEYSTNELGAAAPQLLAFYRERGFLLRLLEQNGNLVSIDDTKLRERLRKRGYVDLLATRGRK